MASHWRSKWPLKLLPRVSKRARVGDPYRGSVYFDSAPSLNVILGTDVYTIRGNPSYDLYRHDGWYYLVDDGPWYRARSWQGPFTYMPMNTVPNAVVTIPVGYRRAWETESSYSRDDSLRQGYSSGRGYSSGTGRHVITDTRVVPGRRYRGTYLTFRTPPRMSVIPGSRVWYVRDDYDFDRDLYRFNNRWYYVENGVWYVAIVARTVLHDVVAGRPGRRAAGPAVLPADVGGRVAATSTTATGIARSFASGTVTAAGSCSTSSRGCRSSRHQRLLQSRGVGRRPLPVRELLVPGRRRGVVSRHVVPRTVRPHLDRQRAECRVPHSGGILEDLGSHDRLRIVVLGALTEGAPIESPSLHGGS